MEENIEKKRKFFDKKTTLILIICLTIGLIIGFCFYSWFKDFGIPIASSFVGGLFIIYVMEEQRSDFKEQLDDEKNYIEIANFLSSIKKNQKDLGVFLFDFEKKYDLFKMENIIKNSTMLKIIQFINYSYVYHKIFSEEVNYYFSIDLSNFEEKDLNIDFYLSEEEELEKNTEKICEQFEYFFIIFFSNYFKNKFVKYDKKTFEINGHIFSQKSKINLFDFYENLNKDINNDFHSSALSLSVDICFYLEFFLSQNLSSFTYLRNKIFEKNIHFFKKNELYDFINNDLKSSNLEYISASDYFDSIDKKIDKYYSEIKEKNDLFVMVFIITSFYTKLFLEINTNKIFLNENVLYSILEINKYIVLCESYFKMKNI